jgi:hypothetical protein
MIRTRGASSGAFSSRAAGVCRTTWTVVAISCGFGAVGCPVDERPLEARPGLIILTGDEGGSGAQNGDNAGQPGASTGGSTSTGGSDSTSGTTSTGGSDSGGTTSTGGSDSGGTTSTGGTTSEGDAGANGSPTSGTDVSGGTSGAGGLSGAGGSGAHGGSGGHVTGRCPDLDDDNVLDCDETIAKNPSFDADASDWSTETNVVLSWQSDDATNQPDSGSLAVEDTFTTDMDGKLMCGARQCIQIDGGKTYRIMVQVSTPSESPNTQAGFQILAYDDKNCSGSMVDLVDSSFVGGPGWQVADKTYTAQNIAKSMVVRLVSVKPYSDAPNKVLFDNVLVRQLADQ